MDLALWSQTTFTQNSFPAWRCPSCMKGLLKLVPGKFHMEETIVSKRLKKDPYWEPSDTKYTCIGYLECELCHEHVTFCGNGIVDSTDLYDPIDDITETIHEEIFSPKFFYPALPIIEIPRKCPREITYEIISSFSLFWGDIPSCANKIRIALELIMDNQKVKRYYIHNHERKHIVLHMRIELFKKKKPEIADFLLATKWIGNEGSHPSNLTRHDILVAYQLLETSLDKLYDDKEARLKIISKEINKRKGLSKRRSF